MVLVILLHVFGVDLYVIQVLTVCVHAVVVVFQPVGISVLAGIRLTVGHGLARLS